MVHYNEIALKGGNRAFFEAKLIENIKIQLNREIPGCFEYIKKISGSILIKLNQTGLQNEEKVVQTLKKTFGIANFSFAYSVSQELQLLKETCWKLTQGKSFASFRITTQRSNKQYPMTSEEINREIGGYVFEKLNGKIPVSMKNAEFNCQITIVNEFALVYTEKIKGVGGMPVATNGKVMSLISGGFDSPVAAWQLLRRGAQLRFIHFHSVPYTSKDSIEKIRKIIARLGKYQAAQKTFLVPFADVQKEIMIKTPAKFRVIFYRRLMMQIAQEFAKRENCLALVTGDSLGQVASQTLENIYAVSNAVSIPIFRPLIGTDKEEIIRQAQEIGTYEISIQPHDDCCTRLMPAHPETKANLNEILEAEKSLDIPALVKKALTETEILK